MEKKYMQDFNLENYRSLLKKAKNKYRFVSYLQRNDNGCIVWRHDVDYSPEQALALARIEKELSVKSVYYVQLSCYFYNTLSKKTKAIFSEIIGLGHDLGLHFDPTVYKATNIESIESNIMFEREILEALFNSHLRFLSFHNPTQEILALNKEKIAGMHNAYSYIHQQVAKYCSDSNGYWRHDRLLNVIDADYNNIHVLTHPEWWSEKAILPREKIQSIIKQKSQDLSIFYDNLLKKNGRKNIG